MQSSLNSIQIQKLQDIVSNLKKYRNNKDKEIIFWRMDTDFLLHLKRWENLVQLIHEKFNENNDLDSFEIIWKEKEDYKKGKQYGYIQLRNDYKSYDVNYERAKESFIFLDQIDKNLIEKKYLAFHTLEQFFKIGSSFGFIFINNDFKINESFTLLRSDSNHIFSLSKNNSDFWINNMMELIREMWDLKTYKWNKLRDISFTILFTYYLFDKDENIINSIIGENNEIYFKKGKKYTLEDLKKGEFVKTKNESSKKWNSIFDGQTTLQRLSKEWNLNKTIFNFFENLLDFIHNKIINDWKVECDISYEWKILSKINSLSNNSRTFQNDYRLRMLSDKKRRQLENNLYNKHDLIKGIKNSKLVEAAHIVPVSRCGENDTWKSNPDNGLLIDPTLHKYYDKDIIAFREDGTVYVKREYKNEIEKIFSMNFINEKNNSNEIKILDFVLSDETKFFIKQRNKIKDINFNEYLKI